MASLIGDNEYYSTWATCRTPVGNGASGIAGASGSHNRVYSEGFKTTEGNGFLRTDPDQFIAFYYTYLNLDSGNFRLEWAWTAIILDQRDADHLIGEAVVLTGPDTLTLTADYLTNPGQSYTGSGTLPIVSVGKLTAF